MTPELKNLVPGPLSADTLNRELAKLVLEVGGDGIIKVTRMGNRVSLALSVEQLLVRLPKPLIAGCAKILSTTSCGGGHYNGALQSGIMNPAPSSNTTMPDGMTAPSSDIDCLIVNIEESGQSTHWLLADGSAYAAGFLLGVTNETNPRPVLAVGTVVAKTASPTSLPGGGATPDTTTWNRTTDGTPSSIDVCTSPWWDTSANTWKYNKRTLLIDARGRIVSSSAETTVTITDTTTCS